MAPTFMYCDPPDVPEGMTLDEYRRARTAPRRRRRLSLRRRRPTGGKRGRRVR